MPSHYHSFSQSAHYHNFSKIYGDDFNNTGGDSVRGTFTYKKFALGAYDNASGKYNPTSGTTSGVSMNSGYTGSSTAFNRNMLQKSIIYHKDIVA